MTTIGFVGLGLMGTPMTRRLLGAGHSVRVHNRTRAKAEALATEGAIVCESVGALVRDVDVVLVCVSDAKAVREVVRDGVLPNAKPGQVVVDFSSIDPGTTRELAEELARRGVAFVDAPVSGGVVGATAGTLAIMAGGDPAVIDALRPILAPLCQRLTRVGPIGAGQVTKIANQMIVACNAVVLAEVFALVERAGVDAAALPEALRGGFADSIPFQLLGPRMATRTFEPVQWRVATLSKDLDNAVALAREAGSGAPMSGLAAQLYRMHASRGFAELDPSTLVLLHAKDTKDQKP